MTTTDDLLTNAVQSRDALRSNLDALLAERVRVNEAIKALRAEDARLCKFIKAGRGRTTKEA